MKIADLFVALGFKVEGGDVLPSVEKQLDATANKAGKLATGVDVVTAGLLYLVNTATNAAVGLNKFFLSTGLSTTELQQWQHTAALANVSAQDLEKTIMGLQEIAPKIMLNGGDAATPWLLLGLSPDMNPFDMLKALHEALVGLNPDRLAAARVIAQQAGISADMFQLLRQKNLPIDALKEQYLLTEQNQQKLMTLNTAWKNVRDESGRVSNKFMSEMAPALTQVLDLVVRIIDKGATFVKRLNGGSEAADTMRHSLQTLGVGIVVLGVILTTMAGITKGAAIAMGIFNLAIAPEAVAVVGLTAAILLLIHVFDLLEDKWNRWKANKLSSKGVFDELGKGVDSIFGSPVQALVNLFGKGSEAPPKNRQDAERAHGDEEAQKFFFDQQRPFLGIKDVLGNPPTSAPHGGNTTSINVEKIQIDGARDPQATGKAVVAAFAKQLTWAGSNAPAQNV